MNTMAIPSGLRFLESLVELIRNDDEVEKILSTIHEAYDEVNEKIRAWGKIKDIDRLRDKAAGALQEATVTLDDAQLKADRILKDATSRVATAKEKRHKADDLIATYEQRLEKLESRETEIAAREQDVREDLAQARALKASFDKLFD